LASALADTGAILALLDRDDRWHRACVEEFKALRLPLLTTAAILTELFHMVEDSAGEVAAAWRFVRSGALEVRTIDDSDLPALESLMLKYRDRPMDFADATLVQLARRERLSTVFSVDRDFEIYRIDGRRRFRIVPEHA